MQVAIDMGVTPAGQPASLDLEELLATRLLVQGNSGSGKSHLLRRLLEQSAGSVQQVVVDPEGDFVTLAGRFGHVVVDAAEHGESGLQQIAARVRRHRVSVVLNLENLETDRQLRHAAAFLGGLFDVDRDHWYPALVVVDEAQLFAPVAAGEVSDEARKATLGAMTNLMCRGRKRGLAGVIATQRLAKLAKNVAAEASNFLMGRTFLDIDMTRAADLLGMERRQAEQFRDLERGHFIALGPALARRPLRLRIGAVETSARAGSPRLMPPPETAPEAARELILAEDEAPPPAPPPRPRAEATAGMLRRLADSDPLPADGESPSPETGWDSAVDAALRAVLAEPEAAYRSIPVLYQDFLVHCRAQGLNGRRLDLARFRSRLAAARAGVSEAAAESPEWQAALALAAEVAEDLRPLYLLLARAALEGAPCPSDAALARARGSRSPRRARGLLAHLSEQDLIACREDVYGKRIVALPGLGWETAPGAADAQDDGDTVRRAPAADTGRRAAGATAPDPIP